MPRLLTIALAGLLLVSCLDRPPRPRVLSPADPCPWDFAGEGVSFLDPQTLPFHDDTRELTLDGQTIMGLVGTLPPGGEQRVLLKHVELVTFRIRVCLKAEVGAGLRVRQGVGVCQSVERWLTASADEPWIELSGARGAAQAGYHSAVLVISVPDEGTITSDAIGYEVVIEPKAFEAVEVDSGPSQGFAFRTPNETRYFHFSAPTNASPIVTVSGTGDTSELVVTGLASLATDMTWWRPECRSDDDGQPAYRGAAVTLERYDFEPCYSGKAPRGREREPVAGSTCDTRGSAALDWYFAVMDAEGAYGDARTFDVTVTY